MASRRVTFTLFAVAYGTNTSTPLLILYRDRLSLSATGLTAVFAVYAAGLLPALLVAGPLSDRLGRRRVALPFVVLSALASLLFLPAASAFPLLLTARFVQGLVSGAFFSVASAWLQDLAPPDRPTLPAVQASLAMNGGFAVGPLVAGLLAQYLPGPFVVPFLLHIALVAVGLVVLLPAGDVLAPRATGSLVRIALPRAGRRAFWTVVAPTAVWVFAFPAVGITLFPLLLPDGHPPVAFVGLLAGATLGTAALVSPYAARFGGWTAPAGITVGAVGYVLGVVGADTSVLPLLVMGGVALGVGAGFALNAGLGTAQRLADPATRGAVNSAFYACAYGGFALPVLLSAVAGESALSPALLVLAGVAVAVAGWLALPTHRAVLRPHAVLGPAG